MSEEHPGFKKVARRVAAKEHEPIEEADAEIAAEARKASVAAKRRNPQLRKVKNA